MNPARTLSKKEEVPTCGYAKKKQKIKVKRWEAKKKRKEK
jgi:ribosomal protein L37E